MPHLCLLICREEVGRRGQLGSIGSCCLDWSAAGQYGTAVHRQAVQQNVLSECAFGDRNARLTRAQASRGLQPPRKPSS